MCAIRVARKLHGFVRRQTQDLLKRAPDALEDSLALLRRSALAARNIIVTPIRDALAVGAGPDPDPGEALADVDHDTGDLAVVFLLEGLADGGEHHMEPELVDGDAALILEGIRPFAAMLILQILPFWPNAGLEEMVIGLLGQFRDRGNVVLDFG